MTWLSNAANITKRRVKTLTCRCETDGRNEPCTVTDDGGNASITAKQAEISFAQLCSCYSGRTEETVRLHRGQRWCYDFMALFRPGVNIHSEWTALSTGVNPRKMFAVIFEIWLLRPYSPRMTTFFKQCVFVTLKDCLFNTLLTYLLTYSTLPGELFISFSFKYHVLVIQTHHVG